MNPTSISGASVLILMACLCNGAHAQPEGQHSSDIPLMSVLDRFTAADVPWIPCSRRIRGMCIRSFGGCAIRLKARFWCRI
jgi:hypothetical protein